MVLATSDTLPEYIRYRDVGCDLHPHCLTCPLPVCKEECTQGIRSVRAHMRGLQVALFRSEGYTVEWIAQVMGITERYVWKALKKSQNTELSRLTDTTRRAKMTVAAQSNGR